MKIKLMMVGLLSALVFTGCARDAAVAFKPQSIIPDIDLKVQ